MMVDDAHASGVWPQWRGTVDITVHGRVHIQWTLSKAIGAMGGTFAARGIDRLSVSARAAISFSDFAPAGHAAACQRRSRCWIAEGEKLVKNSGQYEVFKRELKRRGFQLR